MAKSLKYLVAPVLTAAALLLPVKSDACTISYDPSSPFFNEYWNQTITQPDCSSSKYSHDSHNNSSHHKHKHKHRDHEDEIPTVPIRPSSNFLLGSALLALVSFRKIKKN